MILNNKLYDILKWVLMIAMPAVGALYAGLAQIWGWPMAAEVTATLDCIGVAMGALIGISSANYKKVK